RRNPAVASLMAVVVWLLITVTVIQTSFAIQMRQAAEHELRAADQERDLRAAEHEARQKADAARRRAEALHVGLQQSLLLPAHPGLALARGIEATDRADQREAVYNNALRAALQQCREVRAFRAPEGLSDDYRLEDHVGFTSVRFSPDGTRLVTTSERVFRSDDRYLGTTDKRAGVGEVGTGRLLLTLEVPGLWFHSVDYSPDGKLLVTTHEGVVRAHFGDGRKFIFSDRGVRLWDAETGRELRV